MAESTCLHIQDRESGPIRIVEIPWIAVRIGRAAFCEVRLTDPSLADLTCRLHRRGRAWYITPVAAGLAVVDGQPVEVAQPIEFDAPFRIGPYFLALKRNKFAEPDWRPPRAASKTSVEPRTAPLPSLRPDLASRPELRPRPEPPTAGSSTINPWEARWKAAGDRLKAAKTAAVPPRVEVQPPPSPSPRPVPTAAPSYPPASTPTARLEPVGFASRSVPTPAPPVEFAVNIGQEPDAPVAPSFFDSMSDPVAWAAEARAESQAETLAVQAAESMAEFEPFVPVEDDGIEIAAFDEAEDEAEAEDLEADGMSVEIVLVEDAPSLYETAPCEDEVSLYEASSFAGEPAPTEWAFKPEAEAVASEPEPDPEPEELEPTSPVADPESGPPAVVASESEADRVRSWAKAEAMAGTEAAFEPEGEGVDSTSRFDPTRAPRSRGDRAPSEPVLPSVQDVLTASHWGRREPAVASASKPSRPRPKAAPVPTTAVAPAQWTLPAWLTWPPTTFLVLLIGAAFTLCSWWWAVDSKNAAIAGQTALAVRMGTAKDRPLPKGVAPPSTSWWRTTPLHLAQWGAYLSGTRTDHGWSESQDELITAASAIAPLNPVVRLTKARLNQAAGGQQPASPTDGLGLSRDVVSLAWTARTLHKAGKNEAAVVAYRRALEIVERAGPERGEPLVFSDDLNAPRYLLPGEPLARAIVGELIGDLSWTYRDWSAAIPKGGVAALVAAKGLKEQGRSEADRAVSDLVEALRTDSTRAVDHAAAAEALTLNGAWKDAQQHYRAAIDLMADAKVKRSWWFNLADVAAHLNDENQRRVALDNVLAAVDSDEVSRRALDVQRSGRPVNRPRSNGTKAN